MCADTSDGETAKDRTPEHFNTERSVGNPIQRDYWVTVASFGI